MARRFRDAWRVGAGAALALCSAASANTLDPEFSPELLAPAGVRDVFASPSGQVYVAGTFTKINGERTWGPLVRLNGDGSTDPGFALGKAINGAVDRIVPLADGRVALLGSFTSVGGVARNRIALLTAEGTLDASFAPPLQNGAATPTSAALDGQGRLLVTYRGATQQVFSGGRWIWQDPVALIRFLAHGAVDGSFTPPTVSFREANSGPNPPWFFSGAVGATTAIPLADGRILLGGDFLSCGGAAKTTYLAVLGPNGAVDPTFASPLAAPSADPFYSSGEQGVADGTLLPDGAIVLGGAFEVAGASFQRSALKLRPDLSIDWSFRVVLSGESWSPITSGGSIARLAADGTGRLGIVGSFRSVDGLEASGLAFVDPWGRPLGRSFPFFGWSDALSIRPDGVAVLGRTGRASTNGDLAPALAAYDAAGKPLDDFRPALLNAGNPSFVVPRSNGGALVGGEWISEVNDQPFRGLVALTASGAIDPDFSCQVKPAGSVKFAVPLAEGGYLIGGGFSEVNGAESRNLAVIATDGQVLRAFPAAQAPSSTVEHALLLRDGRVLITGSFSKVGDFESDHVAILDLSRAGDAVDRSFRSGTDDLSSVYGTAQLPDGSIIVGGTFDNVTPGGLSGVVRMSLTGEVDETFRPLDAFSWANVYSVATDPAGRLVLAGNFSRPGDPSRYLVRVLPSGTLDPAFDGSAVDNARHVTVDSDFRLYVEGSFSGASKMTGEIGRLFDDGTPDVSFSANVSSVQGFALSPPRGLFVWGNFLNAAASARTGLAKFQLAQPIKPLAALVPAQVSLHFGQSTTLRVVSAGLGETYGWDKDGEPIAMATSPCLALGPVTSDDAGIYRLTVTNEAGTSLATSAVAVNGVTPTPTPTPEPSRQDDRVRPRVWIDQKRLVPPAMQRLQLSGRASDNIALALVRCRVNRGSWITLPPAARWNVTLELRRGRNSIKVEAWDVAGNVSTTASILVTRKR